MKIQDRNAWNWIYRLASTVIKPMTHIMQQRSLLKRWYWLMVAIAGCLLALLVHPVFAMVSSPATPPPLNQEHTTPIGFSSPPFSIASSTLTASPLAQSSSAFRQLLRQGKIAFDAGRLDEAVGLWERAVQQANAETEFLAEALGHSYLSLAYQSLGAWTNAEEAIARSFDILDAVPSTAQTSEHQAIYAQVLNTQAALQLALGQSETALATWQQSETVYAALGDDIGQWGSLINQAQVMQSLGLYHQATRQLDEIAEILQEQPDSRLKINGLRSLGNLLNQGGQLEQSQVLLEESLGIAQALDLPHEVYASALSLGNYFKTSGDMEQALRLYAQAADNATNDLEIIQARLNQLRLQREAGDEKSRKALTDTLYSQVGQLSPSRPAIYARVNFVDAILGPPNVSTQKTRDRLDLDLSSLVPILSTGVRQARSLNDRRAEAYALGELARLYEVNQQWDNAKQVTEDALALAQSIQANDIAYRWDWQLGRILKQQNNDSAAINAYAEAVTLLQTLRRDLIASDPDLQFSFRQQIEPIYRELVSLLVSPQEPPQSNLKQAREVIESLQLAELENFFRSACLDVQPRQIDDVDARAAVVYPIILPDKLAVVLSLPDESFQLYQTPVSSQDVQKKIDDLLTAFNPLISDQRRLDVSEEMYTWLIRPAEAILAEQQIQTLVFVLDGGLRNIPMAALYDGETYLIEKYQVAITPGLQLLASQQLAPENIEVLVGGLTEARQGFDALPGVAIEANQIASNASSQVYLDQNFTESNLQTQIGQTGFPIVHLATHGQFSSNPEDTFVLTWDDQITIEGLRQLLKSRTEVGRNPIELLVLSACQTAEGDERAALGLAGLSVRSGARSTLATLWAVNDQSTADFMSIFYQELTNSGKGKAESLRATQIELLKNSDYSHPYYWAPFILVGSWL